MAKIKRVASVHALGSEQNEITATEWHGGEGFDLWVSDCVIPVCWEDWSTIGNVVSLLDAERQKSNGKNDS